MIFIDNKSIDVLSHSFHERDLFPKKVHGQIGRNGASVP